MDLMPISFQFVCFSNFDDISPMPDNIRFFLEEFKELNLIPSVIQELDFNIGPTINTVPRSRLHFKSLDESWKIEFSSNRLDMILVFNETLPVSNPLTLIEFYSKVENIASKIFTKLPKKIHRFSLVTKYHHKILSNSMKDYYRIFINPLEYYSSNAPNEWHNRSSSRIKIDFDNRIDNLNVITQVVKGQSFLPTTHESPKSDLLEFTIDINTDHLNNDFRFSESDISKFFAQVKEIERTIHDQINKKL